MEAHLRQGARPSKKVTNAKNIKHYLSVATIARDGLLIVKQEQALVSAHELITVPCQIIDGPLTALYIKLDHPSCHQLKLAACRNFYALDMEETLDRVSKACYTCAALRKIPHFMNEQSTSQTSPGTIGTSFTADVIRRHQQLIIVICKTMISFTSASFIADERKETLRSSLIQLCTALRHVDGPVTVVRVDPATGFSALVRDQALQDNNMLIEIGRIKNTNKNLVAERAVQKLEDEILQQQPGDVPITPLVWHKPPHG